jgi:tripartite-type tricarboxylate transporter receptor subunit TctC
MHRRTWISAAAAAALTLLSSNALAQAWPAKPIKLIVPFPPGGGTDFIARLVAEKMAANTGWVIVVDNRPGAGGNIGLTAVAKAPPDGYTIGLGQTANLAINQALYAKMPFDAVKDFAPIGAVSVQPVVLVVNATSPYKTLADVIAASKANRNRYASRSPETARSATWPARCSSAARASS